MLTQTDIIVLYFTAVIIIGIVLFLVNRHITVIKQKNERFIFNPAILKSWEVWLEINCGIFLTRFFTETMGAELKSEEELAITGEFAKAGVDYTTKNIISQMPLFYLRYMIQFYGEDRMIEAIREKVRAIFLKTIDNIVKRRLNGMVAQPDYTEPNAKE